MDEDVYGNLLQNPVARTQQHKSIKINKKKN